MSEIKKRHPLIIRILHWINMMSITLLIFSGFYIHAPRIFDVFSNMGFAREVHFIFMYIVTFGLIARVYYAIVTEDKKNLIMTREDYKNLIPMMKYYLFIDEKQPKRNPKYNSGQKLIYTSWTLLVLVQLVSGLVLYMPIKLFPLAYLFGGFGVIKTIHYTVTWLFVLTISLHVYLDISEGKAVLKSMITGKGE